MQICIKFSYGENFAENFIETLNANFNENFVKFIWISIYDAICTAQKGLDYNRKYSLGIKTVKT